MVSLSIYCGALAPYSFMWDILFKFERSLNISCWCSLCSFDRFPGLSRAGAAFLDSDISGQPSWDPCVQSTALVA